MKRGLRVLQLCLLAVVLIGLFLIVRQTKGEQTSSQSNTQAAQIAGLPDRALPAASTPESAQPSQEAPEAPLSAEETLAQIDLQALREVNPDVVGWIALPGTEISYPVVQGTDNDYYLAHTWDGENSSCGAIFLDCGASADFSGFHTLVYGHRMRNGTMFTALKDYRSAEFLREHPSVYLVLNSGVYRYDVFSAREADTMGIVYEKNLEGREDALLQDCLEGSVIDTGVTPQATDPILTLSTCTGTGYARRWTVHAVLADSPETPDAG